MTKKASYLILGFLILLGLYLTSFYSYLLFHSLAEIFSIIVACGIFMIAWNSRRFIDNNYLLFIGIAYLFVGAIDLIHTLAYKGMNVFSGYDTNLATQFWIAGRYMESLSLLIAPLFSRRKLKPGLLFLAYAIASSLLLLSVFYWNIFPRCFIEGSGLTPFKKISEYVISLILIGALALVYANRDEFDRSVLHWVIGSILTTIASELAFTFYIDAYGFSNLVGHFFKILSFYFIYKALIETGLSRPYQLLFRNLKKSEEALRQSEEALRRSHDDLEQKVLERTAELSIANEQLRALSSQILSAQESERKRIAQELHDSIGSSLSAIKYSLEGGVDSLQKGTFTVDSLNHLVSLTQSAIGESRRIMTDLRPSILDDLGILATINWFCREFQKIYSHLKIGKEIDLREEEIPDPLKIVIFRIIQEAMNNTSKYSKADLATISLRRDDRGIEMTIGDNGAGFDVESKISPQNARKGFGLTSMKERAELSGGKFGIQSAPGEGTVIRVRWTI